MASDTLKNAPFLAALLFACTHPTEAVTYICGRSTALMTLFLSGRVAHLYQRRTQQSKIKVYAVTPLFFVIALSIKETAVTFPLALLLWNMPAAANGNAL